MICRICNFEGLEPLRVEAFLFPVESYAPEFHEYENFICPGCGVVSGHPEPTDKALTSHYNTAYRQTHDAKEINGKIINVPINLNAGGIALARVQSFYDLISSNADSLTGVIPTKDDLVIDFGAYQGMFLYGVRELWGCKCLAYDFSESGIAFARKFLGFIDSKVTIDIYSDIFDKKAKFATMIHSLEHLREPLRFLQHLRENILLDDGYLYIEVPNLYGIPLCEPVHFFTYSQESLTRLLNIGGFEVLDTRVNGHPIVAAFTAHNNEQNIVCLARPAPTSTLDVNGPQPNLSTIRRRLRASYCRHSLAATIRQFRTAVREVVKFVYYLIFVLILDRLAPQFAKKIARMLGRRH